MSNHHSNQEPATGKKSAKFVTCNPLEPLIRPFGETNVSNEQSDMQQELAERLNSRLQLASSQRHSNTAMMRVENGTTKCPPDREQFTALAGPGLAEEDEDDEFEEEDDDDDDPILESIRQKRLNEIKQQQLERAENLSKGHGQYRTIVQDEFLRECTGTSQWTVVHFFHDEFQTCQIMDHHLQIIATIHWECKFLRLDARKAPFFVTKLNIRTLPTIVVFQHGKLIQRLIGLDGLQQQQQRSTSDTNNRKENEINFPTSSLQKWLASTGAINYTPTLQEDSDNNNHPVRKMKYGHTTIISRQDYRNDD